MKKMGGKSYSLIRLALEKTMIRSKLIINKSRKNILKTLPQMAYIIQKITLRIYMVVTHIVIFLICFVPDILEYLIYILLNIFVIYNFYQYGKDPNNYSKFIERYIDTDYFKLQFDYILFMYLIYALGFSFLFLWGYLKRFKNKGIVLTILFAVDVMIISYYFSIATKAFNTNIATILIDNINIIITGSYESQNISIYQKTVRVIEIIVGITYITLITTQIDKKVSTSPIKIVNRSNVQGNLISLTIENKSFERALKIEGVRFGVEIDSVLKLFPVVVKKDFNTLFYGENICVEANPIEVISKMTEVKCIAVLEKKEIKKYRKTNSNNTGKLKRCTFFLHNGDEILKIKSNIFLLLMKKEFEVINLDITLCNEKDIVNLKKTHKIIYNWLSIYQKGLDVVKININSKEVALISFTSEDDFIAINFFEVFRDEKRRGIGTAIIKNLLSSKQLNECWVYIPWYLKRSELFWTEVGFKKDSEEEKGTWWLFKKNIQ
jgi:hypothetical protein